jgi:hypothetical protein
MMIDSKTMKKISDFVYVKPRSVQEIAEFIGRNWRTADRYVEEIAKETGNLTVRTFREGTKGALKIVYWVNVEKIHSLEFQEKLLKKMENRRKGEFSPFEVYQYVDEAKRNAVMIDIENKPFEDQLRDYLERAENQILSFSGNLSWVNTQEKNKKLIEVVENLAKRNVSIKILSRVTIDSINNVKRILLINEKLGKNLIEVRHCEQPLRGFVIDNHLARFREMKDSADYKKGELDKRVMVFYEIFDPEWIEWFKKVFWYFFRFSIPAEKRIKDLQTIHNIYKI